MSVEYVVLAPSYNPESGGSVVLHHLCHLINESGSKASLLPFFSGHQISPLHWQDALRKCMRQLEVLERPSSWQALARNPALRTPYYDKPLQDIQRRDDVVVIYPETVFGNPLRARHIARWLLHEPGFHSGEVCYALGEVQFPYSDRFPAVSGPHLETAPFPLHVFVVPWDLYRPRGNVRRAGSAYTMRKGRGRPFAHDLSDSIVIDGKKPQEIAEILQRVETFVSYDLHTAYSAFAVIAGCDSVVIPQPGVSIEAWSPDPRGRFGIAYGFDDLERARATRADLLADLESREQTNKMLVGRFLRFWEERIGAG
ncbi:MAG: hypothetical protein FGM40_07865 [Rhodocyclaceae bacterium]|nr:hypothetical protein [Rhodocyclaceae bacterium]